jgi:hypothetical protein
LPRRKYQQEQSFFIWYHRVDLGLSWNQTMDAYEQHWHEQREKGGLQCKFYRILDQHKVLKVREQNKTDRRARKATLPQGRNFGMLGVTDKKYHWMLPQHQVQRPPSRTTKL